MRVYISLLAGEEIIIHIYIYIVLLVYIYIYCVKRKTLTRIHKYDTTFVMYVCYLKPKS